ncbi:nucleotidyltransferase domain-containing protein [Luteibacter sp. Sphag1AF]|uniref:nucleotidyltransferase domain-containing protein n=1 Tax=Luteibacter sp. Sphag1AF TaxID=2587031 RepID=UPI0021037BB9|nr:nucleotidyltransferase domain-containing protein [Luteibacter sp. Sphag1AF]
MRAVLYGWSSIEEVTLYGSRSRGTQRPGSDIDLCVLSATMDVIALARLSEELDELDLPWKIDLTLRRTRALRTVPDPRFSLAHQVASTGVVFFRRA